MTISITASDINPFSSRFTHPATCEFVAQRDIPIVIPAKAGTQHPADLGQLSDCVRQFTGTGFFGQIAGPHGCGKTTLAVAIARQLSGSFSRCALVTVGNDSAKPFWRETRIGYSRWLTESTSETDCGIDGRPLILLDGVEFLSLINRRLFIGHAKRHRLAILMTSHRAIRNVPMVARVQPSLEHFQRMVESLCRNQSTTIPPREVAEIYLRNQADCRRGLRECYDRFDAVKNLQSHSF